MFMECLGNMFGLTVKQPPKIKICPAFENSLKLASANDAQDLQVQIFEVQPCLSSQEGCRKQFIR
jgi:hypothetical protein